MPPLSPQVNFYRHVVPALEALQAELKVPDAERIHVFPKLFGARVGSSEDRVDDDAILVLENLATTGHRCGSRFEGLDLAHCSLAVRINKVFISLNNITHDSVTLFDGTLPSPQVLELARLHALGIVLRRRKPNVFWGPVKEACINYRHNRTDEENDKLMRSFHESSLDLVVAAVPEVLAIADRERLRRAVVVGWQREPVKGPFASICHMDFWVNNMMFAYDASGNPARVKMVDFQLTEISSPIHDLLFFIYSSANSAALTKTDDLLREYHAEVVRYVQLHGEDPSDMGWEAFQKEIADAVRLVISQLFFMIKIIRDKVEKADTKSADAFTSQLGVSEQARIRYVELVSDWTKRGWL